MPAPPRPPLDHETVAAGLADDPAGSGWRLEVVAESPSTNADVAARARAGEPAGLALVAEHQTAGRGRLDRGWVTPPRAALTVSLLVRPDAVPVRHWPWLPLLTGLAVLDAVRTTSVTAALKWPNDVLLTEDGVERKVAGILVERVEGPAGAAAVVGVGLNVTTTRDELPVPTGTSLALAGAVDPAREALLVALLTSFSRRYDGWLAAAGQGLRASYEQECSTLGRPVRVDLPGGAALHGTAVGVDDDGRLRVDDGTRVHVLGAGDVVHVRPQRAG